MPAVLLFAIWQAVTSFWEDYEFYLGSPGGFIRGMAAGISDGTLLADAGITATEAMLGFAAGTTMGTMAGLGLWLYWPAREALKPYLVVVGSVPIFALGPVLIFWFGTGMGSKIVLGFLSTFAIAVVQAEAGASAVNSDLLRLVQVFGGTRFPALRKVVAPSAVLWVLTGIRLNIGMALLGAFIGEFISSRAGLGHRIIVAEGLYDVNGIWVGVAGIIGLAAAFHTLALQLERRAKRFLQQ